MSSVFPAESAIGTANFVESEVESIRIKLAAAGPIPTAVLYNNAKDLANAMVASGIDLILPAGVMVPYAGATEPTGWLFCYGQTLNSVTNTKYARLWAAIGTTYGGASSSSFVLPDLRGRAPHGKDDMGGTAINRVTNAVSGIPATTLGAVGGDQRIQNHTHTYSGTTGDDSPDHNHGQLHSQSAYSWGWATYVGGAAYLLAGSDPTGGASVRHQHAYSGTTNNHNQTAGGASQNMPPTIITNYIIKL